MVGWGANEYPQHCEWLSSKLKFVVFVVGLLVGVFFHSSFYFPSFLSVGGPVMPFAAMLNVLYGNAAIFVK